MKLNRDVRYRLGVHDLVQFATFIGRAGLSNRRTETSDRASLLYGDLYSVSVCRWARVVSDANSSSTPLRPRR